MLRIVRSGVVVGMEVHEVKIEVDSTLGLPGMRIVGLPDAAVREAGERVRAAITNSGFKIPPRKITINLAPADLRKAGPSYDLPIAVGAALALGLSERDPRFRDYWMAGELSLTGDVCGITGALPLALAAAEAGAPGIIVPENNAAEASYAGLPVIPARSFSEVCGLLSGECVIDPIEAEVSPPERAEYPDFADVKGQHQARRALEVAAAGGHHVLMVGPPGSGKSMLARCLPSILPPMSRSEAVDVTRVNSIRGTTRGGGGLIWERPFRSPHHTISAAGLVGGGRPPSPGEISLSHRGVLFLDELAEFGPRVLQALRQPMESHTVTVSRAAGSFMFPADFILAAAMNPCPCGYWGDAGRECECPDGKMRAYRSRLSGPLLDRIDLHVEVGRLNTNEIMSAKPGESSADILSRVCAARGRQNERFDDGVKTNAGMTSKEVERFCVLAGETVSWFAGAIDKLALSARACDKVLKVARTIADLSQARQISTAHLAEAVQYRTWELN